MQTVSVCATAPRRPQDNIVTSVTFLRLLLPRLRRSWAIFTMTRTENARTRRTR